MKENTTLTANVSAHTDAIGNDVMNQKLSERRAKAVKRYLVKKGIAKERITTEGFGEKNPIDSNKTAKGRANNRRAEVRIRLN